MRTQDIAQALGARLDGDGTIEIGRLVHPARAELPSDLALALSADAAEALPRSKAQAAVVSAARPIPNGSLRAVIAVQETRLAFAKLTALFDPGPAHQSGVHATAVVAPDAELGEGVSIGPFSVVGARSHIGAGTTIMSQVTIGADVMIGADGLLHPGVRIGDRTRIGDRVILHPNAVLGSDGFSFAPDLMSAMAYTTDVKVSRVHSLGYVSLGNDVEVGAGSAIDRATIESTHIGSGTKIDNHVHIGHNVTIGDGCIVCGKVGISGSVTIGDRVRVAGYVGIGDHLTIGDEAVIGAGSAVVTNIDRGTFVSGYPAVPHARAIERYVYMGRIKRMYEKLENVASRVDALENMNKK